MPGAVWALGYIRTEIPALPQGGFSVAIKSRGSRSRLYLDLLLPDHGTSDESLCASTSSFANGDDEVSYSELS